MLDSQIQKESKELPTKAVFSSGRSYDISFENDDLKHGVFTYFLLKALRGEAPESKNKNYIDLREVNQYVSEKVRLFTEKYHESSQWPNIYGPHNPDFPLAIRKKR
jgi:uncharacterized caspase-like protein